MSHDATETDIREAADIVRNGGVVAFPTETVYGLGADATNEAAVSRVFSLKGRPPSNPLIVHVANSNEVVDYCVRCRHVDEERLLRRVRALAPLWPGPLSVVVPRMPEIVPTVAAGGDTVALRVPNHPVASRLIELAGRPIAAPSANVSNYVSPTTAQHVRDEFGSLLDTILDGGACKVGLESTVLSLLGDTPTILRPGSITEHELSERLGERVARASPGSSSSNPSRALSPGLLAKHYAPRTQVRLMDERLIRSELPDRVGAIRFSEAPPPFGTVEVRVLSSSGSLEEVAHGLFAALRELDRLGLDLIVVDVCEPVGLGAAIMDRLLRASSK